MEARKLQQQKVRAPFTARASDAQHFTPLHLETRTHVDTATMCWHLGFAEQTARLWACKQTFPEGLQPIRVNGRLKWPVAGIRRVLGVE